MKPTLINRHVTVAQQGRTIGRHPVGNEKRYSNEYILLPNRLSGASGYRIIDKKVTEIIAGRPTLRLIARRATAHSRVHRIFRNATHSRHDNFIQYRNEIDIIQINRPSIRISRYFAY
ncbi:hypothetical protein [Burkholderia ambifaria]|uniref:Uncharacterized protein n=1 Tax=Burkholderia ambifaria TaxID=152480 RepID=A0AA41JJU8_9BURK|nr:hypothetical protein [Burkholderia ambifaria]MBR8129745.1 hypothetical protein [Burkholderia ambifaria]